MTATIQTLGNRFVWTDAPMDTFTRYLPVRYGFGRPRLLWAQEDNKWGIERLPTSGYQAFCREHGPFRGYCPVCYRVLAARPNSVGSLVR